MSKRQRFTVRQVLDEVFADPDSDYDPDVEDNRSESSKSSDHVSDGWIADTDDTCDETSSFGDVNPPCKTPTPIYFHFLLLNMC